MKRKLLLELDLSQAEARAVAWYCGDEGMKNLFKNNIDIHLDRALMLLEVLERHYEYNDLLSMYQKNNPIAKQFRQAAKAVGVHATNYDVGSRTTINTLRHHGIKLNTLQEKTLRANTHERFPGIKLYQYGVQQALKATRTLKTAKGMKRYFFSKLDDNTFRRGYAFPPQCTIAEITNDAIAELDQVGVKQIEYSFVSNPPVPLWSPELLTTWKKYEGLTLSEFDAFVLLQVHDSLLIETPEKHIEDVYYMSTYAMTQPIEVYPFFGEADIMTIPVEVKWGTHWGELKEWKT